MTTCWSLIVSVWSLDHISLILLVKQMAKSRSMPCQCHEGCLFIPLWSLFTPVYTNKYIICIDTKYIKWPGHFLHILCYAFESDNIFVPRAVFSPKYPVDLIMQHHRSLVKKTDCLLEMKLEPWLIMLIDKKDSMQCNASLVNLFALYCSGTMQCILLTRLIS